MYQSALAENQTSGSGAWALWPHAMPAKTLGVESSTQQWQQAGQWHHQAGICHAVRAGQK